MDVLRHTIRVRILEVSNEIDISPIQFLNSDCADGLIDAGAQGRQLSFVSYHFRVLAEAGCIRVVDTRPVRGALEHIYRGTARAYFTDEEWSHLGYDERTAITRTMLQGFIARAEGATLSGTFDSRIDRWLAWAPLKLDEQGWNELTTAIGTCYAEVEQIRHDALGRLADSESEPSVSATFGIFGFESPPMSDALGVDEAPEGEASGT
jgi:hypothetical protein